jgi:hypothetical protein
MKMGCRGEKMGETANLRAGVKCPLFLRGKHILPQTVHVKKTTAIGSECMAKEMAKDCWSRIQDAKAQSAKTQKRYEASYAKAETLWKLGW